MKHKEAGQMSRNKPDIAMPFNGLHSKDSSIAVIAVRPESNKVTFESVILRGITPYADLIYMANLSGNVVNNAKIIESQYAQQRYFALSGKVEIMKYPEFVTIFEEKFNIQASEAKIIGSFEAVSTYKNKIHKSDQELFNTIVKNEDMLEAYGHTIKKIDDYYIINYDMPAIFSKHNKETDIFVIAVKLHDTNTPFSELNRGIFEEFDKPSTVSIIDSESRSHMEWFNQVRRTYHISNSHIKTMFDMTDYILDRNGTSIKIGDTPLGKIILERGVVSEDQILQLRKNPMVRIKIKTKTELVNIIEKGKSSKQQKTLKECCTLIESIQF